MSREYPGIFLTFEGIDGAGKSKQISLLCTALEHNGYNVRVTREPGGDSVGEGVRNLLLHQRMCSKAELLLFLASRAQNTESVIVPALKDGYIVLCDRYIDSSVAYQGYARGLPPEEVIRLNRFATDDLIPDLTFLLDISPALGLARQKDGNRMEAEGVEFMQRAREGFLAIAAAGPGRVILLDASLTSDVLHTAILHHVYGLLQDHTHQQQES